MAAAVPSIIIAFEGQSFAQMPQLIQPAGQSLFTWLAFSRVLHLICTGLVRGTRHISPFGHAAAHWPQASHFEESTTGTPSSKTIAFFTQARSQSPSPRQPWRQDFCPPNNVSAAAQVRIPS
jgi:hypothetical protein